MAETTKARLSGPVKFPPSVSLDSEDLPEIKDWSVGKKYTIQLEVEMTSQSKGDEYDPPEGNDKYETRGRFKILSAKSLNSPTPTRDKKLERIKQY